jgi:hypothetical protein
MKKLKILLLVYFVSTCCQAQIRLGLSGGIANYQGDLTDKLYITSKPAFGLSLDYELNPKFSIRAGLTFAKVAGADSLNKTDLHLRNLSFQSRITEFSILGEFNTMNMELKTWSPYLFAGLAVYHFNPYTFDAKNEKVFLHPLHTEGQGLAGYPDSKPYSLTQLAIPFGGGIKYNVSESVRIAFEIGLRKLFTDHLDDVSGNYADAADLLAASGQQAVDLSYRGDEVPGGDVNYPAKGSQRGSPKYKDYYYISGLRLLFLLPESRSPEKAASRKPARKSSYGCPMVF